MVLVWCIFLVHLHKFKCDTVIISSLSQRRLHLSIMKLLLLFCLPSWKLLLQVCFLSDLRCIDFVMLTMDLWGGEVKWLSITTNIIPRWKWLSLAKRLFDNGPVFHEACYQGPSQQLALHTHIATSKLAPSPWERDVRIAARGFPQYCMWIMECNRWGPPCTVLYSITWMFWISSCSCE